MKSTRHRTQLKRLLFFSGLFVVFISTSVVSVSALNFGSGNYGGCQYGSCSISLSTNGSVALNVTPTVGGSCTIQSDQATVFTDDTNGYSLTLTDSYTNTSLTSGSNAIAASSGTFSSPIALVANSWGYRVDGAGSFGSGPTTTQNNISPPSTSFAGPQANNVGSDTIINSSSSADPAVSTNIWYGVCADTTIPNGLYTSQITYSAVTN